MRWNKKKNNTKKNQENNRWRKQIVFLRKLFFEFLLFSLSRDDDDVQDVVILRSFGFCSCLRMKLLESVYPVPSMSCSLLKTPPFDVSRDDVYRYIISFLGKGNKLKRTENKRQNKEEGVRRHCRSTPLAKTGRQDHDKGVRLSLVLLQQNREK